MLRCERNCSPAERGEGIRYRRVHAEVVPARARGWGRRRRGRGSRRVEGTSSLFSLLPPPPIEIPKGASPYVTPGAGGGRSAGRWAERLSATAGGDNNDQGLARARAPETSHEIWREDPRARGRGPTPDPKAVRSSNSIPPHPHWISNHVWFRGFSAQ